MNLDREIGKIVLHVQNLLREIEQAQDMASLASLEATLEIASAKARAAQECLRQSQIRCDAR